MVDVNLCRTCMKENAAVINLFEKVKTDGDACLLLSDMLQQCANAQVSVNDGLPQKICNNCVLTLQMIHSFQNQVKKAEEEFRKLLLMSLDVKCEESNNTYNVKLEGDLDSLPTDFPLNIMSPKHENQKSDSNFSFLDTDFNDFTEDNSLLQEKEIHTCLYCQKEFYEIKTFEKHIKKCVKKVKSTVDVKIEADENHKYQCPDCDVSYPKLRSLAMHRKKHKNSNFEYFVCDVCSKTFAHKYLLLRHIKIHSAVKYFECGDCYRSFSRKDHLASHVMNNHGALKPYICPICRKDFPQKCNLNEHMRVHTGETPFLCSECGKSFTNKSNLRQHMLRHSGIKPFACNSCPKTFCTNGQLQSHIVTHSGIHPFKCEKCDSAFTKASSLKKHMMIHDGVKPYVCESCNRRFICKDHLKRHARIHTGEKPYRCGMCERAFTQSNDLIKHTRTHVGQNIYQCTICLEKFRLARDLKQHYPIHFTNQTIDKMEQEEIEKPQIQNNDSDPTYTIMIHGCNPGDIRIDINADN